VVALPHISPLAETRLKARGSCWSAFQVYRREYDAFGETAEIPLPKYYHFQQDSAPDFDAVVSTAADHCLSGKGKLR